MAVQLSQTQGAYVCGFCSFTSPDHRVLVKHLVDHAEFKEKKHEHILWCGLCKPLNDANYVYGHQQGMTSEDNLIGSVHHGNYLGYGDTNNYYSGYNGLYNPYSYPNAYYYPMDVAYRNPCFGNVNGYYQTQDTIFYGDYFSGGTDISPSLTAPRFFEPVAENKEAPHNSNSTQNLDLNSKTPVNNTLSNFSVHSNDYNTVNYKFSIETPPFVPQNSSENFPDKFLSKETNIGESREFSKSTANDDLNVVRTNEFGTILNIEPQPESNIQPDSDKTLSKKLSGSQVKRLSNKEIPDPKHNAVKRSPFRADVHKANDGETVSKDSTESLNLKFLPETSSKGVDSDIVDTISAIETNSFKIDANALEVSAQTEKYSGIILLEMTELSENDVNTTTSSTEELPVLFPEAAHVEKIVANDAPDVKNCSIDVDACPKSTLRKKSNSKLHTWEQGYPDNFLGNGPIPAQDMNTIPISCTKSSPDVNTNLMTENAVVVETGSVEVNGTQRIDLHDEHSEQPTGKLKTLPKIKSSISILSGNDGLVSNVKLSSKTNGRNVRENRVSDIQTRSIGNLDLKTKKDKVLRSGKGVHTFERDIGRGKKDVPQLKVKISEDALNQNSNQSKENSTELINENLKKWDKTGAFSNVENVRNDCSGDLNYTNNNCRSITTQNQVRSTYAEVVKRGLPLKSCN